MPKNEKYLTDASLARLAKWLRLLGYDTAVFTRVAGRAMLRLAEAEQRIVLTKRQDMLERQFSGILYLVSANDASSQLKEVITKFSLVIEKKRMFQICLKCNAKLLSVEKETIRDLVPVYVYANFPEFTLCPICQSIYWPGTHQRNFLQFLENLSIVPF
jgi:uncharacterized protein with PIN domain